MASASTLEGQTVVIVGGSSGMGLAVAEAALRAGAKVVLAGRDAGRLDRAKESLARGDAVSTAAFDATKEDEVAAYFAAIEPGAINHLVITAGAGVAHGTFHDLSVSSVRDQFDAKFWLMYQCAKHCAPKLADKSSITFFSGVLSRRPGGNSVPLAATNAAIEAITRALAVDLGPKTRVNCISPGLTRTNAFSGMPEEAQERMFAAAGAGLPVGRVGEAREQGEATLSLITNGFITGVVLDVDGGYMVKK